MTLAGPLDASKIPDLATSAKINDSEEFRKGVSTIIVNRHPNGALIPEDTLNAIIPRCLIGGGHGESDVVSLLCW